MKYAGLLQRSPLFRGMKAEELSAMLSCLGFREESFARGQFIFSAGDSVQYAGLVVSGAVDIIREDFWGNRSILDRALPGELFGEVYSLTASEPLTVPVVAAEHTEVLFLDVRHVMKPCSNACSFHIRLIDNLLSILAGKNLMLTRKIDHISRRTTRQKLLAYLSYQAQRSGGAEFDIPFNRQQLADYLAVDRSAMSLELSRMKQDGLIDFSRNHFVLFSPDESGTEPHYL